MALDLEDDDVKPNDGTDSVEEHPEGLQELTILCSTGQPCARIYQSQRFAPLGLAGDR